jgi:hypothetical protein
MSKMRTPPDVASAISLARDLICETLLEPAAAIEKAAEDWDVRVQVLRARFERAYGMSPEQMSTKIKLNARTRRPTNGTSDKHNSSLQSKTIISDAAVKATNR